ncbi:MAG: phosphoribosylanthranilate isomerase [Oscillospiraceae bacterium]|nr:phosphoribosylanthranilate isomerase [Oscillospiraceae bacterium]
MTRVKLCGLSRPCDIEAANELRPDYIGFVFAPISRRRVTPENAAKLKEMLDPGIKAVGVFVDEAPQCVAALLNAGVIDMAQLHGSEDDGYIARLRVLSDKPVIKAFRIGAEADMKTAEASAADLILLDAGAGTGTVFDWGLIRRVGRPYFLAGGLDENNAAEAVKRLAPFAVDVSSGIETDGLKDKTKMAAFVNAVRKADEI